MLDLRSLVYHTNVIKNNVVQDSNNFTAKNDVSGGETDSFVITFILFIFLKGLKLILLIILN